MTNQNKLRVEIYPFSRPAELRDKLKFVSNVFIRTFVVGGEGFSNRKNISEEIREELHLVAIENIYAKLERGDYRRANLGGYSVSGEFLHVPLTHFYKLDSLHKDTFSYDQSTGLFYPKVNTAASALGYTLTSIASKRKKKKERSSAQIIKDLDLEGLDLDSCGCPEDLDGSLDELVVEMMLDDSSEEHQRARYSTSDVRGEHPQAKFLEVERDKFKI